MRPEVKSRRLCSKPYGAVLSVIAHIVAAAVIAVLANREPHIARFRLPGTTHGTVLLTYYSPGSRPAVKAARVVHRASIEPTRVPSAKAVVSPTPSAPEAKTDTGSGNTAESGAGDGDISIALLQHYLNPHPDLASLPHGTKGDVVLNAVIDEHGHIAALTLLKGVAPDVDEAVISTVKEWTFTPATRNGVPVASEQELHFHYERG